MNYSQFKNFEQQNKGMTADCQIPVKGGPKSSLSARNIGVINYFDGISVGISKQQ
jgi:hypothetical protein